MLRLKMYFNSFKYIYVSQEQHFRVTMSGYTFSSTFDAVKTNARVCFYQNRSHFRGFPTRPLWSQIFPGEVNSNAK